LDKSGNTVSGPGMRQDAKLRRDAKGREKEELEIRFALSWRLGACIGGAIAF
jgi:hypothetical protein